MQALLAVLFLASPIVFVPAALREERTDLWVRVGGAQSRVKEVLLPGGTPSLGYALVVGQGVFQVTVSPKATASAGGGTMPFGLQARSDETTWLPIDGGLPSKRWRNMEVQALAVDPSRPSLLYAGMGGTGSRNPAQSAGLYMTNDGGQTWQTPIKSIAGQEVQAIAVMPHVQTSAAMPSLDSVACAATADGIYCNTGVSQSWVRLDWRSVETRVLSLAIRPDDPRAIYVGTDGFGLQATNDGGTTWVQSGTELRARYVYDIAISVSRPDVMYVATDDGVFESVDAGSTWVLLDGPTKGWRVNTLALYVGAAAASDEGNILYVGLEHGGAYRYGGVPAGGASQQESGDSSVEASGSWVPLKRGLGDLTILSLAVDLHNPAVLWAGTADGIWCYASSVAPSEAVASPSASPDALREEAATSTTVLPTATLTPEMRPTATRTTIPAATPIPVPTASSTAQPVATPTVQLSPTRTRTPLPTLTRTMTPPPPAPTSPSVPPTPTRVPR